MTDLTPPGRAQRPRLADAEWREVVVVHETLEFLEAEAVQLLLVADRPEGHDAQRLRLTAREECRAVGSGQEAHLATDRTDLRGLTAVGPHPLIQDLATHAFLHLGLKTLRQIRQPVGELWTQLRDGLLFQVVKRRLAQRLVRIEQGLVQPRCQELADRLVDVCVLGAWRHLDFGLAHLGGKRLLPLAQADDLPVRNAERLDDLLFGHFLGARLDHDDGLFRAGDDQVELALVHAVHRRVDDQLIVKQSDSDGTDRSLKWDCRDRERQRGAVDRENRRV